MDCPAWFLTVKTAWDRPLNTVTEPRALRDGLHHGFSSPKLTASDLKTGIKWGRKSLEGMAVCTFTYATILHSLLLTVSGTSTRCTCTRSDKDERQAFVSGLGLCMAIALG